MLKDEIIEKISKYFKLTSFEAEKIYNDIFLTIISGVKEDNVVDVTNFGEFIIKHNNGNGDNPNAEYSKTVEFLSTSKFEEEINQTNPDFTAITPSISDNSSRVDTNQFSNTPVDSENKTENNSDAGSSSVEDEMRRKREEILFKISKPASEEKEKSTQVYKFKPFVIPGKETEEVKEVISVPVNKTEEITQKTEEKAAEINKMASEINQKAAEIKVKSEVIKEEVSEIKESVPVAEIKKEEFEDISQKSFSDYFAEVKDESKETVTAGNIKEEVHNVLPLGVVELHNEITSTPNKTHETFTFPTVETTTTGNGLTTNGNGNGTISGEYHNSDDSYYIWYKDVESNAADNQNLNYEYELLYQATKEAEYKSKSKIYVTTFIIFFSIVLVLLLFSPFYLQFFNSIDSQKNETVTPPEQQQQSEQSQNNSTEQNTTQQNNNTQTQTTEQNNSNVTPQVTNNQQTEQPKTEQPKTEQPKQEQPKQEQPKQEQPKQEQPKQETQTQPKQETKTEPKLDGVTKNAMGWMDEKFKVIYVKLDNGRFTIQESAWDSDQKANKRIGIVSGYKINGLSGSILKVDLGDKGTWFRARFGEFASLEEARVKAEELRNKERMKLQASLVLFLLYA